MPVTGANHFLRVTKKQAPNFLERHKHPRQQGLAVNQALGPPHPGMLQLGLGRCRRELVPTLIRGTLGVMRQPVFVGIDTNEIFQRTGETHLFVCLELG